MDQAAPPSLTQQLTAAQAWWRDAGVDLLFVDEPVSWCADETSPSTAIEVPAESAIPVAKPAPETPKLGGSPDSWPDRLEAFADWWLTEPSLDTGGPRPRIPPRGAAGAKLMILVPQPEADDTETLLSGPEGRLLTSFLRAAGMAEEDTYLAAGLARHTALADFVGLAQSGLSQITLHHIGLVAPERLLIFGRDILPLIGHDPTQNPASLEKIYHQERSIPVLVARNLELMLQRPATRSQFWQRWLDWTG